MNRYSRYTRAKAAAANPLRAQRQLAAAAAVHGAVVRDIYRMAFKTPRTETVNSLAAKHRRWLTRVHKTGLAVVEGHLVLDAERFWSPASPAGVTLYDVAYVVQGRGFDVRLQRGVVAVAGKKRVLADGIQNAIRAIDRKLAA